MYENCSPNCLVALRYAAEGFAVFPMYEPAPGASGCSCKKQQNCPNPGKHPRLKGGFKAATTDQGSIRALWSKYPNANIGIATGRRSNLVVIDVDDRNKGAESLEALLGCTGRILPPTRTALTGNGLHYYFRAPAEELRSTSGALGSGIDVRAEDGCVVAPPSLHPTGKKYEFVDSTAEIAELPRWLLFQLVKPQSDHHAGGRNTSVILEGSRNISLTSEAGRLRDQGANKDEITAELLLLNENRCSPPLQEDEVQRIAASIASYPTRARGPQSASKDLHGNPLWWFPFSTRRWNESHNVALMDAEQRGWYVSLMVRAWPEQGKLTSDMKELAKFACAESMEAFESKKEYVLREFEGRMINGKRMLVHPYLEGCYAEKLDRWAQQKIAGRASAQSRKRNREEGEA